MWRSVIGIIAGFFAGAFVVFLIELPGMIAYPPPPGVDMKDQEAMRAHLAKLPFAAIAGVGLAWTVGPFVGAWLAALTARRAFLAHALVIGVVFLAMDVWMLLIIPHPLWLTIVGVVGPLVSSCLGGLLAARMVRPPAGGPRPYDMRDKNMAC